ncbi:membrane hypothetical protein [uncultured Gammaproteobacteria bacterium]
MWFARFMRGIPQKVLCAVIGAMIIAIYLFDLTTAQNEILIAFLYIIPMTLAFFQNSMRCAYIFGALSALFMFIGSFTPLPTFWDLLALLANRAVAMVAIGLCLLVMHYRILSERRLESMIEEERRKMETQRVRVATISHEFRTPLTIIDGHCHYLLTSDCQPAETIVPRLEAIRVSVKRILDLVEGILLSEQIEQDMLDFESRPLDVGVLVADICRRHRAASLNDRIDFSGPIVRLPVKGDDRLLQYAVDNLLSNALKYSPSDSRVEVSVWREGEAAVIAVKDHGIGIPAKEIGKLFDRYFRASNALKFSGNGVGLHLARTVIERHDGVLTAESTMGSGSTFTIHLPLDLPQNQDGRHP